MRTPRLQDETDRQEMQCAKHGVNLTDENSADDEDTLGFGADPFDILAELEARQGYPLTTS